MAKPTTETYAELQHAYDIFNVNLYDGTLPECLITLQRQKKIYGYFAPERFENRSGEKTDEIALNPTYFAVVPLVEIMQTLVHEMAHLWQHHLGTPGRGRYHNEEWAKKMETLGLMPSNTGKPGGKRTGDSMGDYAIEGARFLDVCREFLTSDFKISWYDRFALSNSVTAAQNGSGLSFNFPGGSTITATDGIEMTTSTSNKSNRSKYTCDCDINVWGKPELNIVCGNCDNQFTENA